MTTKNTPKIAHIFKLADALEECAPERVATSGKSATGLAKEILEEDPSLGQNISEWLKKCYRTKDKKKNSKICRKQARKQKIKTIKANRKQQKRLRREQKERYGLYSESSKWDQMEAVNDSNCSEVYTTFLAQLNGY